MSFRRRALLTPWCLVAATVSSSGCASSADEPAEWVDPTPHTVASARVNGVELEYLEWPGDGSALVLLHGFMASPHHFDRLATALSEDARVVAYARRGHGGSGASPPFSVAQQTDDLRALLDELGVERAILGGWSMGGVEITEFAARFPERVAGLIYLDAGYDWTSPDWAAAVASWPVAPPPPEALSSLDSYRARFQSVDYAGTPWTDALEADLRSMTAVAADGSIAPIPTPEVVEAYSATDFFTPGSPGPRFADVAAPALAIYAGTWFWRGLPDPDGSIATWTRSHYLPFKTQAIERLVSELPEVELLVLERGSHASFMHSEHDQVLGAIRRFLNSVD